MRWRATVEGGKMRDMRDMYRNVLARIGGGCVVPLFPTIAIRMRSMLSGTACLCPNNCENMVLFL